MRPARSARRSLAAGATERLAGMFRGSCGRRDGLGRRRSAANIDAGAIGERVAVKHLKRAGFRVVERNVRAPAGEADVLCVDPDGRTVVIVEVKARRLRVAGTDREAAARSPEAALNRSKRRRLSAVTAQVVRARGWRGRPVRVDLIAVDLAPRADVKCDDRVRRGRDGVIGVRHYRGVV